MTARPHPATRRPALIKATAQIVDEVPGVGQVDHGDVGEVGRRPGPLDVLALLEDGGDGLRPGRLEFRSVGLQSHGLAVLGKGVHAPRLRKRRLFGTSTSV